MKPTTRTRRFGIASLATLALIATACGSDDTTGSSASSDAAPEETVASKSPDAGTDASTASSGAPEASGEGLDIVFMQGIKGDEFYVSMECGVRDAAEELGVNVTVQAPDKFDATVQNPMLDAIAAAAPDALLVAPNDVEASAGPLQRIQDGGTEIVLVDTEVTDESIGISRISTDNAAGGAAGAEALAEMIGESGDVLVVNTKPGISTTDARQSGFEEKIAEYDGINYIGAEFSQNEASIAAEIVTATLASNPDLKGIFATNLYSAQGAATGLAQAGKTGEVKIIGFDAGPAQVEQLKKGDVQGLVVQKPYDIGYQAVQQAVAAINGETVEASIATDTAIVTAETMDDPEVAETLYKSNCD